jgi:chromosome segregation ATPase
MTWLLASHVMAKNSREGNQNRNKRYREALAERGIRSVQVLVPESAHPLIRQAAALMTRDDEPMEPRAALRRVGGANEPEPDEASAELLAELDAARSRIVAVEREAEQRRAERDAARAAEATEREKAQAMATKAQSATITAQEAQEQAAEALRRAEKAETAIWQTRSLPGLKGRLVRWLAGDVLPD